MVKLPEPKCKKSPTGAHFWQYRDNHRWVCTICDKTVTLPYTVGEAMCMTYAIEKLGRNDGYRAWLEGKVRISPSGIIIVED